MLEVYDDLQNTAGQKKMSDQSSRLHRSRGRQQQTMQLTFEQYQKVREHDNENEEKNEDDSENEKPIDQPEDDDHDMQGRCFRSLTQLQRRAWDEE